MRMHVIKPHRSEFDYLVHLDEGDLVKGEKRETIYTGWLWCINDKNKGVWIPKNYLQRIGNKFQLIRDYTSLELNINIGEEVEFIKAESGWIFVETAAGEKGWIPKDNLEYIDS